MAPVHRVDGADGGVPSDRTRRALTWLSTATVVLPSLAAVVRALVDGWIATSDNALIAIRSLDVLGVEHHPLVGLLSTVSLSADRTVHHPGPLLFDVLAAPAELLGTAVGIPLAVGTLNALWGWWTISLLGRVGGLTARLLGAVVVGLLTWTMSWPVVIDPWNPHVAMIPALLFFVACGSLALGERRAAVAAVVAGSFCLQAHIGYLLIIASAIAVGFGVWLLERRTRARAEPWSPAERFVPLAVLVVLWLQPLIDLVVNRGDSNVVAMADTAGSSGDALGPSWSLRIVAAIVAVPPWWMPNGFDGPTAFEPPPSLGTSILWLLALIAVLGFVAWRGPTRPVRRFALYVAVLVPLAIASVALVPLIDLGGFSRHHWRWLWSLGALATLVLGWAVAATASKRATAAAVRPMTAGAAAACASVVILNLVGDVRFLPLVEREHEAVAALVERLPFAELERCSQVVVDYPEGLDPPALVAPSVLLALRERDIEVAPTAPDAVLQLDRRRRAEGVCRLALSERYEGGRLVGSLEAPLALSVTFTPEE